jgi:hypothetical protein
MVVLLDWINLLDFNAAVERFEAASFGSGIGHASVRQEFRERVDHFLAKQVLYLVEDPPPTPLLRVQTEVAVC